VTGTGSRSGETRSIPVQYNLAPRSRPRPFRSARGCRNDRTFHGAVGGGFTWSKSFPLYLEGNLAYTRLRPTFIATMAPDATDTGEMEQPVGQPSGSGGIRWARAHAAPWPTSRLGRVTRDLEMPGVS